MCGEWKNSVARQSVLEAVASVSLPDTAQYYEAVSADGFGFLGYARLLMALPYVECLDRAKDLCFTLYSKYKIRSHSLPLGTSYMYTLWPNTMLCHAGGIELGLDYIRTAVEGIGRYPDGMSQYCSSDMDYCIPNVTACAAHIYALLGDLDRSVSYVMALDKSIDKGNWWYNVPSTGDRIRQEDGFHLAMMVYALRKTSEITGCDVGGMVDLALEELRVLNRGSLCVGKIGWGGPMLYLATLGIDDELCSRALEETRSTIGAVNFRARAYAAWALAEGCVDSVC